uniref:N-acetyltransferase domain-containing protein n=1 Tax=Ciona savignyi TaxID=51511 RepID=H2ZAC2_CIOSA
MSSVNSTVRSLLRSNTFARSIISKRSVLTGNSPQANKQSFSKLVQPSRAASSGTAAAGVPQSPPVICRPCYLSDREAVIDFMSTRFVTREPLMKAIGATPQNSSLYVEHCIDEALIQGASFLALDDVSGKVCGVRLNAVGPSSGLEMECDFGTTINAIPKFLNDIEGDMVSILGTDQFMRHIAICVEESASQCGIATQLMVMSVQFAKQEQLKHLTAMCSWKLPFKLATKMGFRKVREFAYADYAAKYAHPDVAPRFLKLSETESAARVMVRDL